MNLFLEKVREVCSSFPDVIAFENSSQECITYGELAHYSDALASHLASNGYNKGIVAFCGHKQPNMLVVMLACMKAGACYVPLDTSFPNNRIENIMAQLSNPLLIEVEKDSCLNIDALRFINADALAEIINSNEVYTNEALNRYSLNPNDSQYILFTSGSTGDPKGVVQPARSFDSTFRYFEHFIPTTDNEHLVFFNRAHFSFDLSLFDLVLALPFGHTLFALDKDTEESLAKTFQALRNSGTALWVSTPSFLNLCLADPNFNQSLLPNLCSVVVCGETLFKSTALQMLERFPNIQLFNSYGPTETQGAIADIQITGSLLEENSTLPVGKVSPFNNIYIIDPSTKKELPRGEKGEICITGKTLSTGYYGRDDLTRLSFGQYETESNVYESIYYTGDKGWLDDNDVLWFEGRFDNQVKVNGFRIELQEIEASLDELDEILESCVTVNATSALSQYLIAHIVTKDTQEKKRVITKRLKESLKTKLPHYMIPRVFKYYDTLPKSVNGKIDRKKLSTQDGC